MIGEIFNIVTSSDIFSLSSLNIQKFYTEDLNWLILPTVKRISLLQYKIGLEYIITIQTRNLLILLTASKEKNMHTIKLF